MAGGQHARALRGDPVQAPALPAALRRRFAESRADQAARFQAVQTGIDRPRGNGASGSGLDGAGDTQSGRELIGTDAKQSVEQELFEFPEMAASHNPTSVVNIAADWTEGA